MTLRSAGKFFVIVAVRAVIPEETSPVQLRLTDGGVQLALALTWLWHCP
jgi:hypothetical protein